MSIGIYNTTRAKYLRIFLTSFRRIEKFSMLFSDYGTIRLVFHIQFSVFKNNLSLITVLDAYQIYKIDRVYGSFDRASVSRTGGSRFDPRRRQQWRFLLWILFDYDVKKEGHMTFFFYVIRPIR